MKAEDFVKQYFPKSHAVPMIDNYRRQTSYVILKGLGNFEIFPNEGSTTASNAWVNAKKQIKKEITNDTSSKSLK